MPRPGRDDDGALLARARADLHADCSRCVALCCVATAFVASADVAIDKPAGRACPNLTTDLRCGIHAHLRERGFPACAAFDCLGAGQAVTQRLFPGVDWRRDRSAAPAMFEAFSRVRVLHELLWYVIEAGAVGPAGLRSRLDAALVETRRLARLAPEDLLTTDVEAHRARVNGLLVTASEHARRPRGAQPQGADHRGADLAGRDLRRTDLRRANLRGALLLGADLRGADLALADLTGADLRAARLDGADLGRSLFLTPQQLGSALGDAVTRLPSSLDRPAHWGVRGG